MFSPDPFTCILYRLLTLEEAHKIHPASRWWIKADGCDIVSGPGESWIN